MLHAEPSESVLLALILCILCMYFLKWKLHRIRVPHYLIQNSYTLLSSKLRILIRTNLVLTSETFTKAPKNQGKLRFGFNNCNQLTSYLDYPQGLLSSCLDHPQGL